MKPIINYLSQLGFSKTEIIIYINLLKNGPMTVTELAEEAKINRTASYSHINSLLQKGIIAKTKGKSRKIIANPPENLHYLVEQKAIRIGMLQEKLPTIIFALNASFTPTTNNNQSEITYYKGKNGVKAIYQECFKADKIRSYFNFENAVNIFPENRELFLKAFTDNPKIIMYEIIMNSSIATEEMKYFRQKKLYCKMLPKDVTLTDNDILIYNGKVAIINTGDKNNVTGVVLSNRDYYNNSVQLFDLLWRLLPEMKKE
jgi:sugar-specific transcriptional regulator TrmB